MAELAIASWHDRGAISSWWIGRHGGYGEVSGREFECLWVITKT